jgi:hypothetical protein
MTLCGEWAYDWFHDLKDKKFKTIRDLLHAFLEVFGHARDEFCNELVDDFMEKWKRKNLLAIETTSLDIKMDAPPNPIEELKEIILNMQYSHTKQLEAMQLAHARQVEAMNEQLMAMEDQLDIMENDFTETYIEYPDPLELELDSEKNEEVHWEILDESMDEPIIHFEEVKELEFENVEYIDDSSPHPPLEEPIFVNVYAIIIVLCISIDKSIIRTRSLRNTHSQETQHLSWETL